MDSLLSNCNEDDRLLFAAIMNNNYNQKKILKDKNKKKYNTCDDEWESIEVKKSYDKKNIEYGIYLSENDNDLISYSNIFVTDLNCSHLQFNSLPQQSEEDNFANNYFLVLINKDQEYVLTISKDKKIINWKTNILSKKQASEIAIRILNNNLKKYYETSQDKIVKINNNIFAYNFPDKYLHNWEFVDISDDRSLFQNVNIEFNFNIEGDVHTNFKINVRNENLNLETCIIFSNFNTEKKNDDIPKGHYVDDDDDFNQTPFIAFKRTLNNLVLRQVQFPHIPTFALINLDEGKKKLNFRSIMNYRIAYNSLLISKELALNLIYGYFNSTIYKSFSPDNKNNERDCCVIL
jgi:hypothetical protein